MPSGSPEHGELRIELAEPNELFELTRPDVASGTPTLVPGIERIRSELSSGSLSAPARLEILLPLQHATPRTERGIREAVVRYCETGIRRVENELKAIHRDGRQALLLGLIILGVSLALSEVVLRSGAPLGIRDFFGNGLLLVAAWVGMWYPLDMLIYAGRPHRLERRLLRTILGLEISVRSADAPGVDKP
jgi:hypothetical protein